MPRLPFHCESCSPHLRSTLAMLHTEVREGATARLIEGAPDRGGTP